MELFTSEEEIRETAEEVWREMRDLLEEAIINLTSGIASPEQVLRAGRFMEKLGEHVRRFMEDANGALGTNGSRLGSHTLWRTLERLQLCWMDLPEQAIPAGEMPGVQLKVMAATARRIHEAELGCAEDMRKIAQEHPEWAELMAKNSTLDRIDVLVEALRRGGAEVFGA